MKNKQGLTIAALIIAIVGLSIGFAAFSNNLTISSSASVNPDSSAMNVVFSSSSNSVGTTSVVPTKNEAATSANIDVTNATISGNTLSNLSAEFTAPGQSVTYSSNLYVYNAGQLQAQLSGIVFNEAETNYGSYKKCVASTQDSNGDDIPLGQQATPSLVTAACNGISISVTIGAAQNVTPESTLEAKKLGNQMIAVGSSLPVSVTISYDGSYVDGPMEVTFGDIEITATSAVQSNPWLTRGLTSSNVLFDKTYVSPDAKANDLFESIAFFSNGSMYNSDDGLLSSEDVNLMISSGTLIVEEDYVILDVSDDAGVYLSFVFGANGTMTVYVADSNTASFTKDSIVANRIIQFSYSVSN